MQPSCSHILPDRAKITNRQRQQDRRSSHRASVHPLHRRCPLAAVWHSQQTALAARHSRHRRLSVHAVGAHVTAEAPSSPLQTGGTLAGLKGGENRLIMRDEPLRAEKYIVVVRHGITTWNSSSRIQGDNDEGTLTEDGEKQAARVRDALIQTHFDRFAEIMWEGREGSVIPFEPLKEANLGWLQGMSNADAAKERPEEYKMWREKPAEFLIDGVNPIEAVFKRAKDAWQEILDAEGSSHLLVTHKSIMRAMMCVALGLPEKSFRAVEIHNGGVSVFRITKNGEPMLVNMNMTAHMHCDGVTY